jgi:hypothetical protein
MTLGDADFACLPCALSGSGRAAGRDCESRAYELSDFMT